MIHNKQIFPIISGNGQVEILHNNGDEEDLQDIIDTANDDKKVAESNHEVTVTTITLGPYQHSNSHNINRRRVQSKLDKHVH